MWRIILIKYFTHYEDEMIKIVIREVIGVISFLFYKRQIKVWKTDELLL